MPLRLGETGYSTAIPYEVLPGLPASPSAREAEQGYYLRSLALVARRVGLPSIAPWILSDFAAEAIPGGDVRVRPSDRPVTQGRRIVIGLGERATKGAANTSVEVRKD